MCLKETSAKIVSIIVYKQIQQKTSKLVLTHSLATSDAKRPNAHLKELSSYDANMD
jgi:hypothetical protein